MATRLALCGLGAALILAAAPAAGQAPTTKTPASAKNGYEVTVIGCVEPERQYRADLKAKPGGPLGTEIGQGDEYVLVKARPISNPQDGSPRVAPTSGEQGDYLLTGKTEKDLKEAIGREVEVVGIVQRFHANDSAKEDRDRLPRLAITTWHPVQDYCPAAGRK